MNNQIYLKVTNSNETHHGLKFKDGLIEDPLEWNSNIDCEPGGIYFTTPKYICEFLRCGIWLREVTIPKGSKVTFGDTKHKANKLVFGKRWDLRNVETWEYLVSIGANIHANDDYAIRWASAMGHFNIVKYLIEHVYVHSKNNLLLWTSNLNITKYIKSKMS